MLFEWAPGIPVTETNNTSISNQHNNYYAVLADNGISLSDHDEENNNNFMNNNQNFINHVETDDIVTPDSSTCDENVSYADDADGVEAINDTTFENVIPAAETADIELHDVIPDEPMTEGIDPRVADMQQLEEQLQSDLNEIQDVHDEFLSDSNQMLTEFNDIFNSTNDLDELSTSDDGADVASLLSLDNVDAQRGEDGTDGSLDSNQRSEDNISLASNSSAQPKERTQTPYDLRPNPTQSSETTFNKQFFKYSFLQQANKLADDVDDAICSNLDSLALQKDFPKFSKRTCLKIIGEELSKLQQGIQPRRDKLQNSLIQLIYLLTKKDVYDATSKLDWNEEDFLCFTQMSAKKGLEAFGQRAMDAMVIEYEQLEDLKVFTPFRPVYQEKKSSLNAIDLIKEKRTGKIKGRTVCDGRKQRGIYAPEDVSSPALSQDGFFATLAIDALENRHIATSDIAGAFLKADQNDFVSVRLSGPAVDAMLKINKSKYAPFVLNEKGKKVIYVRLLKAMYGTLTAPILWYKLFASTLLEMGFTINPYDLCVANKVINGKQMTICWYVDDLKVSHVDEKEVKKMIERLEQKFGKMSTTYGKNHTYLGMDLNIDNGEITINMQEYLKECIVAFGEGINSAAKTPAMKNLLNVNDESPKLSSDKAETFHHIIGKLLHVAKRARLDILPTVTFMCRRVKAPTEQDWGKLKRLLQYIHGTLDMKRKLSIKNFSEMLIYIDASHAPNDDAKGQTGGCISMGTGILHGNSTKQKLNTKSSTETELVGASDYLPYALWFLYFIQEQGFDVRKKVLLQDNQSTVKLLKNGKVSAGKQSRHINIRYFWITDRVKQEGMTIEYCPTGTMLADFFTKPLQGSLFKKMRDIVQGHQTVDILDQKQEKCAVTKQGKDLLSCLLHNKERVGKTVSFELSDETKQDRLKRKEMYVGSYGKTYYPTYANKAKGLCKMNNIKRKNDFIILSK